jgi:hypothetical protein
MKLIDIEQWDPCHPGLKYYLSFNSFEEFWENCDRGDWMMIMLMMLI